MTARFSFSWLFSLGSGEDRVGQQPYTSDGVSSSKSHPGCCSQSVKNEINQSQILTVDNKEIRNNHMVSKVTCLSDHANILLL